MLFSLPLPKIRASSFPREERGRSESASTAGTLNAAATLARPLYDRS